MNDVARAAAENRVEFVFAGDRKARRAAVLQALEAVAVVPAPRTLADVAGERRDISYLRRRNRFRRFSQHRELPADRLVPAERVERREAADRRLAASSW